MSKCCFIDFKSPMPHESELELEERKFQLKIHNEKIERVSETKFLGVVIDEKLPLCNFGIKIDERFEPSKLKATAPAADPSEGKNLLKFEKSIFQI